MASFGTFVVLRAEEMTFEIAMNDSVDSFPPDTACQIQWPCDGWDFDSIPFRIAAFPDLIASAAIFAITSGRASKMINRTPIGHVTRSNSNPSSRRVRSVTFPTTNIYQLILEGRKSLGKIAYQGLQDPEHRGCLSACPPISLSSRDPISRPNSH